MSYYKNYNKFNDLKHSFIIIQSYSPEVLVQMAHLSPPLSLLRKKIKVSVALHTSLGVLQMTASEIPQVIS